MMEANAILQKDTLTLDKVCTPVDLADVNHVSTCDTRMNTTTFSYMWTIRNLRFVFDMKAGSSIQSSTFSPPGHDSKWLLKFYPNGDGVKGYCSIYLCYQDKIPPTVEAEFIVDLLEPDIPLSSRCTPIHLDSMILRTFGQETLTWGWKTWKTHDSAVIKRSREADKLTIYCTIRLYLNKVDITGSTAQMDFKVPDSPVAANIENFWKTHKFSDFDIVVCGKNLRVHKFILAAHSPVFLAMFDHDMKEQRLNKLEIKDIDYDVFEQMLCYIYTGKAKKLKELAISLLSAADKYALEGLKYECEKILCSNITVENVLDILVLADLHNTCQLKLQAMSFIMKHLKFIKGTAAWDAMIKTQSHLVIETLCSEQTTQQDNN